MEQGEKMEKTNKSKIEVAYFAAGCFWGVEKSFFEFLKSKENNKDNKEPKTEVGYMGGDDSILDVNYEIVCSGKTEHAETVKIIYDSNKVSYGNLLDLFFRLHNPTEKDRQGPDIGNQYRSVIFYTTEEQKKEAEEKIKKEKIKYSTLGKVVYTELIDGRKKKFYKAEDYHQRYFQRHEVYCHI